MNYNSFSKMPREIIGLDVWLAKPYDKAHALADIIMNSCDYPSGKHKKGCVYRSQRWFAARWGWDRDTVARFLHDLEEDGILTIDTSGNTTTLTLVGKGKTLKTTATNEATNGTHSRISTEEGGSKQECFAPPIEEWEDIEL